MNDMTGTDSDIAAKLPNRKAHLKSSSETDKNTGTHRNTRNDRKEGKHEPNER